MGVPQLFISLVKNKAYSNILAPVSPGDVNCDYLLLDFNGSIYNAYGNIIKNIIGKNLNKNEIEEHIINEIKRELKELVCDIMQPKKLLYIAIDGPAPFAKIAEQRGRRYKAYYEKILYKEMKKKLNVPDDKETYDLSANAAPGTQFMEKLANELTEMIENKALSTHNENMEIIFSSSNNPGESEHKIMPVIRNLAKSNKNKDATVYIMSKDADLIQLSVLTHKSNIHILRIAADEHDKEIQEAYSSFKYFAMNIDSLREGWVKELSKENTFTEGTNPHKVLTDYTFLLFFVGTDFVRSLSFMKIKYKNAGFSMLKSIYNRVKVNHSTYLIDYDFNDSNSEPRINNAFFKDIIRELALTEDKYMKAEYLETLRQMKGPFDEKRHEEEKSLTPFDIFDTRYKHVKVCHSDHPLFKEYRQEFLKIDPTKPKEEWRDQFYNYYLGISKDNLEEYNKKKVEMVINYFESLIFNLKYYTKEIPSWKWHYRFRQAPLPSDMLYVLDNVFSDLNSIEFEKGEPYTPFEQLMLILPPQNANLVPEVLRPIMTDLSKGCVQYYPETFKLGVAEGVKTMYSHPLLPEIDIGILIPLVKEEEEKLNEIDRRRNEIKSKPVKFVFNK